MTGETPGAQNDKLYFDDLSVGQQFVSASHRLDERQIKAFAAQFDPQPFHLDDEAARASLFGGLVASGWHTASLTMKLIVESSPFASGIVGAGTEIAWPKPTRPDDVLQVESVVMQISPSRSRPDRGTVILRSETRNQHGEVVQILTSKLVIPRRVDAARSEA